VSSLVFAVCCVGSGLCDESITCSEESYRLCFFLCDVESSRVRRPKLDLSFATQSSCLMMAVLRPKHVALM